MTKTNWYILYTRPRHELKVAQLLTRRHIKNYCPLHHVEHPLLASRKSVLEPLFHSYVFVCIGEDDLGNVLSTPGVLNYLYWLNKPATIENDEIESIASLLKEHDTVVSRKCEIRTAPSTGTAQQCPAPELSAGCKQVKLVLPSLGYCIVSKSYNIS